MDLAGDKWTLVLVRDMLNGKARFNEFLDSPEGIPTNILTNRLRRMEEYGLIEKKTYSKRPLRHEYTLTNKGRALLPVLQSMCRWANRYFPVTWKPPANFMRKKN
jgi:DNA-binding HxlR family transcriptional regulator